MRVPPRPPTVVAAAGAETRHTVPGQKEADRRNNKNNTPRMFVRAADQHEGLAHWDTGYPVMGRSAACNSIAIYVSSGFRANSRGWNTILGVRHP